MTERMRSRIQAVEMSFLRRVAGYTLLGRMKSLAIREELKVEPLLLHIKRSQFKWFRHLIGMPPGCLPVEVYQT